MEAASSEAKARRRHHQFVLVHGMCHGAWCWYKAATALRRAGHAVTAPDMAGCGAHPARVDEVRSFEDYSRPLLDAMAALPEGERVVLVAHSHGGYSVALAVERFPEKVAAAVFVTASMPAVGRPMAATSDELLAFVGPDFFLDSKELEQENPEIKGKPFIFGPNFMAQRLYHLSPPEDLTLGLMLIRPANTFTTNNTDEVVMRDEKLVTEERYGSARRVFVVVEEDRGIPAEFQRRMVAQSPGVEMEEIAGADHMVMLSQPQELVELLASSEPEARRRHHFVLVHGRCHGAWCWYKAATALLRAGHRATALDMAGCGAHPARLADVRSFEEYSRPLLDAVAALPEGERVVLVAHSHGGYSVALAAERFPEKVAAAVFVTASMPAVGRPMAVTSDKLLAFVGPDFFLDSKELEQENPEIKGKPFIFGPNSMTQRLYHLSPPEDLTLGLMLIRPANTFTTNNPDEVTMRDAKLLTEERYGSARRVFVVVEEDRGIPAEFQRRMVAQSPGVEVEEISGADHMVMLSRPQELVELLVRIANKCTSN
ncbi:hypothetical protein EJB05_35221, partial [Eragrostis curvula]